MNETQEKQRCRLDMYFLELQNPLLILTNIQQSLSCSCSAKEDCNKM